MNCALQSAFRLNSANHKEKIMKLKMQHLTPSTWKYDYTPKFKLHMFQKVATNRKVTESIQEICNYIYIFFYWCSNLDIERFSVSCMRYLLCKDIVNPVAPHLPPQTPSKVEVKAICVFRLTTISFEYRSLSPLTVTIGKVIPRACRNAVKVQEDLNSFFGRGAN